MVFELCLVLTSEMILHESILFFGFYRLNANPLPIPYHRPKPSENVRLSNGNMVMIPPGSPRKTVSNKQSAEKSKQQQNKSASSKTDISCKCVDIVQFKV